MKKDESASGIPVVLRARGWRLYTQSHGRLTDLWQSSGAAVLGHRPPRVTAVLKSAAGRGLYSSLPSIYEKRLKKALERLFPQGEARIYRDKASLLLAVEKSGIDKAEFCEEVWRPFGGGKSEIIAKRKLFVPLIPFPLAPAALIIDKNLANKFPASDIIPPVILAAASKALNCLIARPDRSLCVFKKVENAIARNGSLRREGIYIYGLRKGENAEERFIRFLRSGFFAPPPFDKESPLILPGELSDGEETKLAKLLEER